jgi:hypothetical protein
VIVKKKSETFNNYTVELSFGELKAIYDLACRGSGAMVDEIAANLEWYFKRIPPPGADEPEGGEGGGEGGPTIASVEQGGDGLDGEGPGEQPGPGEEEEVIPDEAPAEPSADTETRGGDGENLHQRYDLGGNEEAADQGEDALEREDELPVP